MVYDGYEKRELVMKSCKQCSYMFGIDDTFSCEEIVKRMSDLDMSLTLSDPLSNESDVMKDITDSCELQCPCGNKHLLNFLTYGSDDIITCEKCGMVIKLDNDGDSRPSKSQETLITSIDMLRPGDHILWCYTKIYEHHAIFIQTVGENIIEVFQFSRGTQKRVNKDTRSLFNDKKDPVYRVEYDNPANPHLILKRAEEKCRESKEGDYNLLVSNCEHFATYCQTGNWPKLSDQVKRVLQVIGVVSSKTGVKLAKEIAHSYGLRLVAKLAVSASKRAVEATEFQKFLCSLVKAKVGALGSNAVAFGIMVSIEVVFFITDVKAEERKNNGNLKSFLKWRLGELACRTGTSGILALVSFGVTCILVNCAVVAAWPYVLVCGGFSILSFVFLSLATCLSRWIKRWRDRKQMVQAIEA